MKFLIALVLASLIIVNGDPTSSSTSGEDSSSLEGTQLTGQMQGQLPGAFRGFGGFGRGFGGFGRGFGGGFGGLGGFGLGLGLGSMLGGGLGMGGYGMYPGAFMNPYGYGGMYGYGLPGFYQSTGAATATTPELSTSAAGAGDLSAPAPASVPLSAPIASPSKKSTSGQFTSVLPAITNDAQTLNTINLPDIMKPYSVPMQTSTQENIKQPVIQPVNQPYLQRYVSQAQPIVQPIVNRVVQPVIHRQLKPFLTTQKIEGPAAYTTTLPAQYQSFTNQPIIGADLPSLSMPMASRAK